MRLRLFEPQTFVVGTDGDMTIGLFSSAGTALDVSGASAVWRLYQGKRRSRARPFKGQVLVTKTSDDDITLSTGEAVVAIAAAELANLFGEHWHTLEITDVLGNKSYMGGGELFLQRAAA